jgi:ribonuclease HII
MIRLNKICSLLLAKIAALLLPFFHNKFTEAGVDEAGRGCYAGPVFAAAVILPKDFYHPVLNDSKQLTKEQRDCLRPIIEKESIAYAVASVSNDEIDRINILQASFKAMHLALNRLDKKPEILLIDGNRFKRHKAYPHHCIIKGDGTYASIAAASVLAKTYRDEYMQKLHKKFKMYSWHSNKGYGTAEHRAAIDVHGLCRYHRKSFNIYSMRQTELCENEMLAEMV